MMHLTKKYLSFLNCRDVGIFKVVSITRLANIFESFADKVEPFNFSLSFYFYHRLCTELSNTCTKNLFLSILFLAFIDTTFENIHNIVCIVFI